MSQLHNKVDGKLLKKQILEEKSKRITLSFYRYYPISNPQIFRDHLFLEFEKISVLGRIYIAKEGINAQISVPGDNFGQFRSLLNDIEFLRNIRLNSGVEDNGKSFFKLKIKIRKKIVADGLDDYTCDLNESGIHLDAKQFNAMIENGNPIIIDMRNHYESEVGHFRNSILPEANTFKESLKIAQEILLPHKDKDIIMYCTGGIRCEKASAYFKHLGYPRIYQLDGGIIKYANDVKENNLPNHFIGKNFVFDERLGERISDEIIAHCYQCGQPCDTHRNCSNPGCNILMIQCEVCRNKMEGCCSESCLKITKLTPQQQKLFRKGKDAGIRIYTKGISK
jgi:UPF0176 protein